MKRIYLLVILLVVTTAGAANSASDTLTAVIPANFPPHYIVDKDGKPGGFAIEIMDAIAAQAGLTVYYRVARNWAEVNKIILEGGADLIPNNGITEKGRQNFLFTSPIETIPVSLFVRSRNTSINSLADLPGHKVAVVKTNIAVSILQDTPGIQLELKNDVYDAVYHLLSGDVDAAAYPRPTFEEVLIESGIHERVKVVGEPLVEIKRGIALRKDLPELHARLEKTVTEFIHTEEYRTIYSRWYATPPPYWNLRRVSILAAIAFLVGFVSVFAWRQVTLQRKNRELNEKEQLLRKIAENYPNSFLSIIESDYTVGFTSGQEFKKLNIDPASFIGLTLDQVFGDQADYVRDHYEKTFQGESRSFELFINDQYQHYQTVPLENPSGKIDRIMAVVENITQRKLAELKLKEYSEDLSRLVAERTADLEDAQEKLIRSEKLANLGQMAGSLGHELRNPLGIMSNAVYFLTNIHQSTDETVQEYLELVSQEIDNSTKIITDLLDFGRLPKVKPVPVSVPELVSEILKDRELPEGVELSVDFPPGTDSLIVDPGHLRQILDNIVNNALQAIGDSGQVKLESKRRNGKIIIRISDNGPGIEPEMVEKIFEPLFTTKARGIGLGLAISKNLAEANAIDLSVSSNEGQGTVFELEFSSEK